MNRHFKYAVLLAGVAAMLFVWCGRAGAGPDVKPRLPDAAREAERLYEKQIKDLRADFGAKQLALFKAHVSSSPRYRQNIRRPGTSMGHWRSARGSRS